MTPPQSFADDLRRLAEQVEAAQKQLKEMEPNMWFVNFAKWICGAFALATICTAGSFIYSLGYQSSEVKHHAEAIDKLEKNAEKNADENRKTNADLIRLVLERFPRPTATALSQEGTVSALKDGKLSLKVKDKTIVLQLLPETEITRNGRKVAPADLKPGARVRVVVREETALAVEILD